MDQTYQGWSASIPSKKKRVRPRSDEVQAQQQVNTATDENLIGRMVSGVVEGCFEAGYFLNVKVADTDKHLKGIVFLPGKVTPVTPTTDLFPQAKMYAREDVTQSKKDAGNQTDDENQSAIHTMSYEGVGSEAIDETNLLMDTEMKDVGGSSAEEKLTEPEGKTLSLMPQFARDDALKEDHTVLRSEACGATPETSRKQVTGSSSTLSLDLFQNETKRSGTEDKDSETRGMEGKLVSPLDDVPKELQLELGNTKMSDTDTATETNPDQTTSSSKGGFLANLFESREDTAKGPEETNAGSGSGFLGATTTTQVDDNGS